MAVPDTFRPFIDFFDPSDRSDLPDEMRRSMEPIELSLSASGGRAPMLSVSAAWADDWWFTMLDGWGVAQARGDRAGLSRTHVLLAHTLNGQNRPSGKLRALPRPGEMMLMPWIPAGGVISSGEFRYLIGSVPKIALSDAEPGDVERLLLRPVSALAGSGAILASALRTLLNEASRSSSRADAAHALPAIARLITDVFSAGGMARAGRSAPDDRLDHIIGYLEDHLSLRGLTADNAAFACGMSKRQLFRSFAGAGRNFADILRTMRIERARDLLAFRSDLSVEEVARLTGFSSSGHLSRIFRDVFGTTPLSYRRRQRSYQQHMDAPSETGT